MYTYKNDRYYLPFSLPDGRDVRVSFEPGAVVLDSNTDVVLCMHVRFRSGKVQDLVLLPAGKSEMQALDLIADLLGEIGARVLSSQVAIGNALFDRLAEALVDHIVGDAVGTLKKWMHQKNGAYYDIRTGELCVTKVLEKYDVEFD
jgi:hypothetical protein